MFSDIFSLINVIEQSTNKQCIMNYLNADFCYDIKVKNEFLRTLNQKHILPSTCCGR